MARLSEIFDLQMGKTPARANHDYWDKGTNRWVSIADLSNYEKYVGETKEQITDIAVQETGIKAVPPNTVIMSFKLSLGKTAITQEFVYTNEAIMAFVPNGNYEVSPDYFFYMLSGIDWSKGTNRAVMGATLNKATLGEVNVTIPPLSKQCQIAAVLDKVSNLISLRKQQLAKLDELVKARFAEMFGDLVSNPSGWKTLAFDEAFDIVSSKRILKSEWKSEGIPFLRVRDMVQLATTGKMNNEFFVSEEFFAGLSDSDGIPVAGDILVSATSTLGKCYIVNSEERFYFKDADVLRFRPKISIDPVYFVELMKTSYIENQIAKTLGITTVSHFTIAAAKKIYMRCPDYTLQQQFSAFVRQIKKQKLTIQQSLEKLEVLKKSLMQEYFGHGG